MTLNKKKTFNLYLRKFAKTSFQNNKKVCLCNIIKDLITFLTHYLITQNLLPLLFYYLINLHLFFYLLSYQKNCLIFISCHRHKIYILEIIEALLPDILSEKSQGKRLNGKEDINLDNRKTV